MWTFANWISIRYLMGVTTTWFQLIVAMPKYGPTVKRVSITEKLNKNPDIFVQFPDNLCWQLI